MTTEKDDFMDGPQKISNWYVVNIASCILLSVSLICDASIDGYIEVEYRGRWLKTTFTVAIEQIPV